MVLFLISCVDQRVEKIKYFIDKDNIQYWNYEWKRKYTNEFGQTFRFENNGILLKYNYVKKNSERQVYREDIKTPYKWWLNSDTLVISDGKSDDAYRIVYFRNNTVKLINTKFKDTSLLLRVNEKFKIVIKKKRKISC